MRQFVTIEDTSSTIYAIIITIHNVASFWILIFKKLKRYQKLYILDAKTITDLGEN